ncbi:MAG: hypothetical protein IPN79_16695 [Saprospiraceae bacterium]|nr:hypothetical protein [Saprospiraceae bacterium]
MKQIIDPFIGKIIIITFLLVITFCDVMGQANTSGAPIDTIGKETAFIKCKGEYLEKGKVVLRWVPPSPGTWKKLNYFGYKIERAEIDSTKDQKLQFATLADSLKPLSLEKWKVLALQNPTDTMLMVAGQSIHGEYQYKPFSIENLEIMDDQLNNYFTACIFATGYSALAGNTAALRFEDKTVEPNKIYVYRIIPLLPESEEFVDQGLAYVFTNKIAEFPKVVLNDTIQSDKYLEIFWDKPYYAEYYSSFNIYKSFDKGKTYQLYTPIPVVFTAYKDSTKFVFPDSTRQNYVDQYYKIQGITYFSNTGPLSDPIILHSKDRTPPTPPKNIKSEYVGPRTMKISWELNPDDKDIAGIRISRSNEVDKGFMELTATPLDPKTRTFIDTTFNELFINYYFIGIYDKEGNPTVSEPHIGNFIDSFPPVAPLKIQGKIDTTGLVTVTWNQNKELDLRGYYIYLNNNNEFNFHRQNGHPTSDTVWQGKIPLNVLTEKIYIKLKAVDNRMNHSDFSEVLTLQKPDLIAPVSPVFGVSEVTKDGIMLQWTTSKSIDVIAHVLERKEEGRDTKFEIINKFEGARLDVNTYVDKNVKAGKTYSYRVYAVDDAGLISPDAGVLTLKSYYRKIIEPVTNLTLSLTEDKRAARLQWNYQNQTNVNFSIYKNINETGYITYKIVKGQTSFEDIKIKKGDIVKYRVKVVDQDGKQSEFSEEVVYTF